MSRRAIQGAVWTRLSADAPLTALGVTIRDIGPRVDDASGSFPYVLIGDMNLAEFDTDQSLGFDVALRVHSYSNTGSNAECADIQDAVYASLHLADLTVSGYKTIVFYREDSDMMQSSSGAIHGVCDYRAIITKE